MKGHKRFGKNEQEMIETPKWMSNYEPCLEVGKLHIEKTEVAGAVFGADQRCVPKPKDVHYEALLKNFKSIKKIRKKRRQQKNRKNNTVAYPQSAMTSLRRP